MTTRPAKLPWPSRFMALQYKLFNLTLDRRAAVAAHAPATTDDFTSFDRTRQALVVTFRSSGEPVATPVNIALRDGKLYFRSEPHVAKISRLRSQPTVHTCPCGIRGRPTGPIARGTARVLTDPNDAQRALSILDSNWNWPTKRLERLYDRINVPAVYVEIQPATMTTS